MSWEKKLKELGVGYPDSTLSWEENCFIKADKAIAFIKQLLQRQRENCAIEYEKEFSHKFAGTSNMGINSKVILNAPEPSGEQK